MSLYRLQILNVIAIITGLCYDYIKLLQELRVQIFPVLHKPIGTICDYMLINYQHDIYYFPAHSDIGPDKR